jgi:AcrR family transcriptional regulator
MPPKFKFKKEEIVECALQLVREEGNDALTARALGARLGSSPKPIFGLFSGMDEVQSAVIDAANVRYLACQAQTIASQNIPPYKAMGMAYIRFAIEEPQLFRLLFMREREASEAEKPSEDWKNAVKIIEENLGLNHENATVFQMEMWSFVHGIAAMYATNYLKPDLDLVSAMLTDLFQGLRHRFGLKGEVK